MEFNEKLRQLRIGKNLTQEQLAFIATAKQDKIKIVINSLKTGSDTVSVGTFFIVTVGFLHFELCG